MYNQFPMFYIKGLQPFRPMVPNPRPAKVFCVARHKFINQFFSYYVDILIIGTFIFGGPFRDDCLPKWHAEQKRLGITVLDHVPHIIFKKSHKWKYVLKFKRSKICSRALNKDKIELGSWSVGWRPHLYITLYNLLIFIVVAISRWLVF
jgi:hypothetical protein